MVKRYVMEHFLVIVQNIRGALHLTDALHREFTLKLELQRIQV